MHDTIRNTVDFVADSQTQGSADSVAGNQDRGSTNSL